MKGFIKGMVSALFGIFAFSIICLLIKSLVFILKGIDSLNWLPTIGVSILAFIAFMITVTLGVAFGYIDYGLPKGKK